MTPKAVKTPARKTASTWTIPAQAHILLKVLGESPDQLTREAIERCMPALMAAAIRDDDGYQEVVWHLANELFLTHAWSVVNRPEENCSWPTAAGSLNPEEAIAAAAGDGFKLGVCYGAAMTQR